MRPRGLTVSTVLALGLLVVSRRGPVRLGDPRQAVARENCALPRCRLMWREPNARGTARPYARHAMSHGRPRGCLVEGRLPAMPDPRLALGDAADLTAHLQALRR